MSFLLHIRFLLFISVLFPFSSAAGVLRNLTVGLADPLIAFSPGWSTALYAGNQFVFADGLGDEIVAVLPGASYLLRVTRCANSWSRLAHAVAVHYVGFRQSGGALYAACLDCQTANATHFIWVDASDPCEDNVPVCDISLNYRPNYNPEYTPQSILFTFTGLDPGVLHTLEVVNLEDPAFGFTSQITFHSLIVTLVDSGTSAILQSIYSSI